MRTTIFTSALLASVATAFPLLTSRAVIAHDKVQGFPQTVPSGLTGDLYLKYKPWLEVYNGCVPFPGVQANGDTSGGLATSGSPNGGCSSSLGQVYSRGTTYNGRYAIMYSWYWPKDSPSSGLGHRHDWENIVVWLSSASSSASIVGVAVSAHGEYDKKPAGEVSFSGTRPNIGYISYWPVNHQMIFAGEQGGEQPLIAWESLPAAARSALETTNFESATVPFKESTFLGNLAKAQI